jgi:hypothetical protein
VKGSVYQRGSKWYYKFRLPHRDPSTGEYPWISKGGFDTEREAWKACREAMRQLSQATSTTIHAARDAVRRYRAGLMSRNVSRGLAPKTIRNIHAFLHRALADAVAWKYLSENPASNVKPPRNPPVRRQVWKPEEIRTFLASVREDPVRGTDPPGAHHRYPARAGLRTEVVGDRPRRRLHHRARQPSRGRRTRAR